MPLQSTLNYQPEGPSGHLSQITPPLCSESCHGSHLPLSTSSHRFPQACCGPGSSTSQELRRDPSLPTACVQVPALLLASYVTLTSNSPSLCLSIPMCKVVSVAGVGKHFQIGIFFDFA